MGDVCHYCGKEVDLGYRCNFCNLVFCEKHRLPEQHNCSHMPDRNWETYRNLKNAREGYGWPISRRKKNSKTPNQSEYSKERKPDEELNKIEIDTTDKEHLEKNKKIYIWLMVLTVAIIGIGLYVTGYYKVIEAFLDFSDVEDFTSFQTSDSLRRYSITKNSVYFTELNRRDTNQYIFKPFTSNGNFILEFDLVITSIDAKADQYLRVNLVSYTDQLGDYWTLMNNGGSQICLSVGSVSNNKYFLILIETYGSKLSAGTNSADLDLNQNYHVVIEIYGNSIIAEIYDDGNFATATSYTLNYPHNINYIMLLQSMGYPNGNLNVSGLIQNLKIKNK